MNLHTARVIGIALAVFLLSEIAYGQFQNKPQNFYAEVLGAGGWGSVNYERRFGAKNRLGLHGGIGYFKQTVSQISLPFGATFSWPIQKDSTSFLVAGVGATHFIIPGNLFGANKQPGYSP